MTQQIKLAGFQINLSQNKVILNYSIISKMETLCKDVFESKLIIILFEYYYSIQY